MPKKLTFFLTEKDHAIIEEKLLKDKSSDDVNEYLLTVVKNSIIAMKTMENSLLKKHDVTSEQIEKVDLKFNENYQRENQKKRVIFLYGTAIYEGIEWAAKFQQLTNKFDKKVLFSCVEDFVTILIQEHVEGLVVELFASDIDKDYKKSQKMSKEGLKN